MRAIAAWTLLIVAAVLAFTEHPFAAIVLALCALALTLIKG